MEANQEHALQRPFGNYVLRTAHLLEDKSKNDRNSPYFPFKMKPPCYYSTQSYNDLYTYYQLKRIMD